MLSLQRPTAEVLAGFLERQAALPFSYPAVGATAATPPAGYIVNHQRGELGHGAECFAAAQAALAAWSQFRLSWISVWPQAAPLRDGEAVVIVARIAPVWWLSACRICYVVDEAGPVRRFGFAYGTLPDHAARGEERFLIEWDAADDRVWFDILSFSRPKHQLSWLAYPRMRALQRKFCRESTAAVRQATQAALAGATSQP